MNWIFEIAIAAGVAIYTINFGRWMARRDEMTGAYGAYGAAFLVMASVILEIWRHEM